MRTKAASLLAFTTLLVIGTASTARASDPYGKVVSRLETKYHAKRKHIPFVGLGNFVLKFWHPAGLKSVQVALFEGETLYGSASGDRLDAIIASAGGGEWHPIVREFSRANNQWTYVYYADAKDLKIMVLSLAKQDSVVAQVRFNPDKLAEFIENPKLFGHSLASDIRMETTNPGQVPETGPVDAAALTPSSPSDTETDRRSGAPPTLARPDKGDRGALGYREDASPHDPEPSTEKPIKLEARLVNLNVSAVDHAGVAAANLTRDDFSVYENGVKQNIAFFETNDQPVNLLLLLDLSQSTRNKIKLIKKAATRFVDSLLPADRVAVAAFTRHFYQVSDFTADHKLVKERIDRIKNLDGGTAYYDAMWSSINLLDAAGNSRKALVVLTDGVDQHLLDSTDFPSKHSYEEMIHRISEDDVTVYPIYLDTEWEEVKRSGETAHKAYAVARGQLYEVAEETGGTMMKAVTDKDLDGAYQKVAAELHSLYSMAYAPTDLKSDGRWREINVKTDKGDITVKARRGFYDK